MSPDNELEEAQAAIRTNIAFFRAQKQLSLPQIAERAALSVYAVDSVCSAHLNTSLWGFARVARALGVSVADLLRAPCTDMSDDAIAKRSTDTDEMFVDADDFLKAIDENRRGLTL